MSEIIKMPGRVIYPSLRLDEEDAAFKPYANYVNGLIQTAIRNGGTRGRSQFMDGDSHSRIVGRVRVEYLDSPWGNDHYYVYWNDGCVYHCQDTPGRMTLQEHVPGNWLSMLEGLS